MERALQPNEFIIAVFKFVILIFSLCVHECAHAWSASRLGDQTARLQGRLTLNPVSHVDPLGTIIFPGIMIFGPLFGLGFLGSFLIGWAKPTPVITRNFRRIVRDDTLVTLAGPASNLLIVLISFILFALLIMVSGKVPDQQDVQMNMEGLGTLCGLAIDINIMLFFFNLIPIPPLDGSRILRHYLPYTWLNTYDSVGGMLGWGLMIFVGAPIVGFLMRPAEAIVNFGLQLVPRF